MVVRPACRVAYTLNNTQPVLCTIIGSQPLFYMDFDMPYEDIEGGEFDAADLSILDQEINTLKQGLDQFDSFSKALAASSEEKVDQFLDNAFGITSKPQAQESTIESLKTILAGSRLASAYLNCAEDNNVALIYSAQVETAIYDRKNALIMINPALDEVDQVFLAVQELRRHYQHRQGALIHPLTFHPDNAVLINRAQSADLITSVIRTAWELQLSGFKEAWDRIENSSMADLGRAFAREAYLDFRTINNGQAMAAVFEAWFLSERCRSQDKLLINQMLADHQGYVFDLQQSEQALTPSLIAALGAMPFGKNYLAEHAMTIMDDAIFTDVRDRSNANFLWFIKFERSFRETEQELQTNVGSKKEGVRSSVSNPQLQDESYEPVSAQIISFSFGAESETAEDGESKHGDKSVKGTRRLLPKGRKSRNRNKKDVSNVIYLRCWSGE